MRPDDAPEKWQDRARPRPSEPAKLSAGRRVATFLLFLAFIGAGVGAYVLIARDTTLKGSLPLPAKLKTTSPAHEALLLFGRELEQLAVDAEGRLPHPDPRALPTVNRLLARLGRLQRTGRDLAPQVSREESRALYAFEHAERLLREFISSAATTGGRFDPRVMRAARAQIQTGLEIARGRTVDELVTRQLEKLRESGPSSSARTMSDLRDAGSHLRLGPDDE